MPKIKVGDLFSITRKDFISWQKSVSSKNHFKGWNQGTISESDVFVVLKTASKDDLFYDILSKNGIMTAHATYVEKNKKLK